MGWQLRKVSGGIHWPVRDWKQARVKKGGRSNEAGHTILGRREYNTWATTGAKKANASPGPNEHKKKVVLEEKEQELTFKSSDAITELP